MLKDLSCVEMGEKIGSGAFGSVRNLYPFAKLLSRVFIPSQLTLQVFKGLYLGQPVAIKVLEASTLNDDSYRSFVKEGKLMLYEDGRLVGV
jgi:hypothetical protein